MSGILAFPVLGLVLMIQISIVGRINLLSGSADLFLVFLISWAIHDRKRSAWIWAVISGLMVGYVSALPWYIPLISYLAVVGLTLLIRRMIWQTILLEVFVVIFLGTILMHILSMGYLAILGNIYNFTNALGIITLPSILLNLILAIPVYLLVRDFASWVQPVRESE